MRFFLITFLVWTSLCNASPQGSKEEEIRSLDLGACWIQRTEESFRVASFNESVTFEIFEKGMSPLSIPMLHQALTEVLRPQLSHYQEALYRVHFFCSSAGHRFFIQLNQPDTPLCIWGKANPETGWEIHQVASNFATFGPDSCLGYQPKTLMVTPAASVDVHQLKQNLESLFPKVIEGIEVFETAKFALITLKDEWKFREHEFRTTLESHPQAKQIIGGIDYDYFATFAGETELAFEGTYPGFLTKTCNGQP